MTHNLTFTQIVEKLSPDCEQLYVVPLIRYSYKRTDYLYLLHKEMIENDQKPDVISTSFWGHATFVWSRLRGHKTVLHYNWFECQDWPALIGMIYKMSCIWIYKLLGGNIIWSIHNKDPHDRNFLSLNRVIRKWMARKADILRVHCQTAVGIMSEHLNAPESKFKVAPHPRFPSYLLPRSAAIEALNQRDKLDLVPINSIFLMFGNISRYKQIIDVAEIFKDLKNNKKLLIAGPVKKGHLKYYRELVSKTEKVSNVMILPKFIDETSVPEYLNAASYCLFNYNDILTSGGVELAKSYQKPVIAPAIGCLRELRENENVTLFNNKEELREILTNL